MPSASAIDINPWDVQGSYWTGTITTTIHRKHVSAGRVVTQDESASFSDLEPVGGAGTSSDQYTGHITGNGTETDDQDCNGSLKRANDTTWSVNRDNRTWFDPEMFALSTDDNGVTSFAPYLITVPFQNTGYPCQGGDPVTSDGHFSRLGWEWGTSGAFAPLTDSDPDPFHLAGSRTWTMADPPYEFGPLAEWSFAVSYDLTLVVPDLDDPVTLRVDNRKLGGGVGTVRGADGAIDCGPGASACQVTVERGTSLRVAGLPAESSLFFDWMGCDTEKAAACTVEMDADRVVTAFFTVDREIPDPDETLLDNDRKAEVASNAVRAARNGRDGCFNTALALSVLKYVKEVPASWIVVNPASGKAEAPMVEEIVEKTVVPCVQGYLGTVKNGVLLKVDPPDPDWRKVALPTRTRPLPPPPCRIIPANCAAMQEVWTDHARAQARVSELREAAAVAANRFGNAVKAGNDTTARLHRVAFSAWSGMLADAIDHQAMTGRQLAAEIRAAGLETLTFTKSGDRRIKRAVEAGRLRAPRAVVDRLLGLHLVPTAKAARAQIRQGLRAPSPQGTELLRAMSSAEPTTELRSDAHAFDLQDLELVVHRLQKERSVDEDQALAQLTLIEQAWRCDVETPDALAALADLATTPASGLGSAAGQLVAAMATSLSSRGAEQGAGCAA